MKNLISSLFRNIKRKESAVYLVLFISGISLFGLIFNKLALASFSLNYIPIALNTCIVFIILSTLFLLNNKFGKLRFADPIVIIAALYCTFILLGYIIKFNLDSEKLLEKSSTINNSTPGGLMSPITGLLFIFTCIGILGINRTNSKIFKYISGSFSLIVLITSSVLLIGYLYKAPLLYGSNVIPVALPTAICFFLFSLTLLRTGESRFWSFNMIKYNSVKRILLKTFLPIVIVIVVFQGYLITNFSINHKNSTLAAAIILFLVIAITILVISRVAAVIATQIFRAEHALKESEEKYRTIVDNVGEGIGFVDQDEEFVFANPASENIFGVNKGTLAGRNLKEFLHDDEYLAIKKQTRIRKNGKGTIYESELTRPDGTKRNILVNAVPQFDDNNNFIGTYGIFRDITDGKLIENALLSSVSLLNASLESTADGILIVNSEGKISKWNQKFAQMWQLSEEILSSQDDNYAISQILSQLSEPVQFVDKVKYLYSHPEESSYDQIMFLDKRIFERQSFAQKIGDEIVGRVWSFRDITQRKNAELLIQNQNSELLKLNTDKDLFMSILAHDLKSPFNTLLGFSELLAENIREYDIEKIDNIVKIINKSAQSNYNLLEDLLYWTQSQSGKIPFKPEKISFSDLCNNIIENLKPIASNKNITVNCSSSDKILVFADINMLKTIMRNLTSNAIKFSKNSGKIEIFATENSSDVLITVSDNGVGMDKQMISKLFEFSQVKSTPGTANEKGTGLGLVLCKEFVEKHNGKIWVESELGKGCDFKFTLPYDNSIVLEPKKVLD